MPLDTPIQTITSLGVHKRRDTLRSAQQHAAPPLLAHELFDGKCLDLAAVAVIKRNPHHLDYSLSLVLQQKILLLDRLSQTLDLTRVIELLPIRPVTSLLSLLAALVRCVLTVLRCPAVAIIIGHGNTRRTRAACEREKHSSTQQKLFHLDHSSVQPQTKPEYVSTQAYSGLASRNNTNSTAPMINTAFISHLLQAYEPAISDGIIDRITALDHARVAHRGPTHHQVVDITPGFAGRGEAQGIAAPFTRIVGYHF
jgi:hypothetical protein